jgi:hypothetical protein
MDKNGAAILTELKIRGGDLSILYKTDKVEELHVDASLIDVKHDSVLYYKDQSQQEIYIDIAAIVAFRFVPRIAQPGLRPAQGTPAPARPARGFER